MGISVAPRQRPSGSIEAPVMQRWSARGEQAFIAVLGAVQLAWVAVLGYTLVRLIGAA